MSEQSEEAKMLFFEMVHDFGEYTVHKLAGPDKGPVEAAKAFGAAVTVGYLLKAVVYAYEGKWDKTADTCVDMAASAVINAANFATHGNFGAIKGIVWDLAVAAHVAQGHKVTDFAEVTKHVVHKVGEKSGEKVFEFFHPISLPGSEPGIADYYARHPEMYKPHIVDGTLHYDRYEMVGGQMLLLHPGFVSASGEKVFLSPDQKSFHFESGLAAKVTLDKIDGKEVAIAKVVPVEISKLVASSSAPAGKSIDAVLKAIEKLPVMGDGSKLSPDSSNKAAKIENVLKQIDTLNKSIDAAAKAQKTDPSKAKVDNVLKAIDQSLSGKAALDLSKSQKPDKPDPNKAVDSFDKAPSPNDGPAH